MPESRNLHFLYCILQPGKRLPHLFCVAGWMLHASLLPASLCAQDGGPFANQADRESRLPVYSEHLGVPPTWTQTARRFIFAPRFAIAPVSAATGYRFELSDPEQGRVRSFEAGNPAAPLTPIWMTVPPGRYRLAVYAVDGTGLKRTPALFLREILKSPAFTAMASADTVSFYEAGLTCLQALSRQQKIRTWLETGEPDSAYALWVHPSKMIGAVLTGMSALSRADSENPQPVRIARTAARFLLNLREPADAPLALWPPTFWDGVPRGSHPVYMDQIMTNYPADAGMALLNLFEADMDSAWLQAAVMIAETYRATQQSNGTWPQLVSRSTGAAARSPDLVPATVIRFFDRLMADFGAGGLENMRARAWAWVRSRPMRTGNWQAQFEDTRPKRTFVNLSPRGALAAAEIIYADPASTTQDLQVAGALLRFAEDGFLIWSAEDPVAGKDWFKPQSKWNGNADGGGKDWFYPCALEQYAFYTPISGMSANFIRAFIAGYRRDGEELHLAKAAALAAALVSAQEYHGTGEFPTHLRRELPEKNWLNVSVNVATTLMRNDALLRRGLALLKNE